MPEYTVPEDDGPLEMCVRVPAGQIERETVVQLRALAQTATGERLEKIL